MMKITRKFEIYTKKRNLISFIFYSSFGRHFFILIFTIMHQSLKDLNYSKNKYAHNFQEKKKL
jgi:hypothetical protein